MSERNIATSTSSSTAKFKIEQRVPSGAAKKGPYAVERSVDPDEVVIKRRFGEGSTPLFQRDDIDINRGSISAATSTYASKHHSRCNSGGSTSKPHVKGVQRRARQSSTDSSSPERYRSRATHSSSQLQPSKSTSACATTTMTTTASINRRTPEKVPYFLDEKREKDRLRRIYGSGGGVAGADPTKKHRHRSYSRSPSNKTPSSASAHAYRRRSSSQSRSKKSHVHASSSAAHRRRSSSGEDQRRRTQRSSHHSSRPSHRATTAAGTKHKHRSSRSLSRSRSRSRERRKRNSRSRERGSGGDGGHRNHDQHAAPPPATQIITIPVPMADYPFGFPTWHPPHAWGAIAAPPPRFAPYPHGHHMGPMMPVAAMLRPPLPYGLPPRMFRPRYPPQHNEHRPTRGFYRPRNT